MSSQEMTAAGALDECVAKLIVIVGMSCHDAHEASFSAIRAYLKTSQDCGSDRAVDLMQLYNRVDEMQLSGATADAIRAALDDELRRSFDGQ